MRRRGDPAGAGWFDSVIVRYAGRVNGLTGLAITKLDVLDTLPELRLATRYRLPGGETEDFPADTRALEGAEPVYETLPGWERPTSGARCLSDLPGAARRYLERIEALVEAPVEMVSVGSRRREVIQLA